MEVLSSRSPYLESLELRPTFGELGPHDNLGSHMLRAPTLRSLHYNRDTVDLPTHFHYLTDLRVSSSQPHHGLVDPQQAIEMLLRCSHSLRICALDMRLSRQPQVQNGLTVELPHLEQLIIRYKGVGFFNISLFLGSLAFYVLDPLLNKRRLLSEPISFLPSFLQRSQCDTTLRSLSLFIPVDEDIVISWLRLLPTLTTLRIVSDLYPVGSA
ncbi:hypothetical protein V5O48_018624 [Marasmius crinis-equi]|uniref:Uncharacterized protein n=1 Tax=Marasmius crinis-equi TaxID=585013 RepID=A0ABR3EKM6_9AGAR